VNPRIDWPRVRALFDGALDVPDAERERWISGQCAGDRDTLDEVRSLLAARGVDPGDFLSRGALLFAGAFAAPSPTRAGASIGPYAIQREIGAGGMGRVFLARRADGQYERDVALKLIRSELASPELVRRFLRERDTLARLSHPNIATLLDGGVAGDAPYFTMEFVEGEPIDRWCDAHAVGTRERVALVVAVCEGVQYAHANLVIHRDIKPSNILVGANGAPKLLDFGIARPLEPDAGETQTLAQPMTREYAAPEQVLGEPVTIATDVYGIGVLLYRLLCGRMPYARAERGETSWAKAIVDEAPEPLERALGRTGVKDADSTTIAASRAITPDGLRRALRGDLDRIVQRALAKTLALRYPTADALADDLRAFLDRRALSGDTRTWRARKFARRHWLPLAAGTAAVLAILIGSAGIAWEARQRAIAAESALHEAAASAAVKDFVVTLFQKANPNETRGRVLSLRDAVDLGVQRLDRLPDDQGALKAELEVTLAQIYFELDQTDETAKLAARAFDVLKSRPEDAVLAARAERFESTALATAGDLAKAASVADDSVRRLASFANAPPGDLAEALHNAGWIALKRGDIDALGRYVDAATSLSSRAPGDDTARYFALQMTGDHARRTHDYARAADAYRAAIALNARVDGADNQQGVTLGHTLALTLEDMGRYDEALAELDRTLAVARRVFGPTHSRTLRLGEVAAVTEFDAGRIVEANDRLTTLVAQVESSTPRDEALLAEMRLNDAMTLAALGRRDEAAALLAKTRDFLAAHDGSNPDELAATLSALAAIETGQGRLDRAESHLRDAQAALADERREDSAIVEAELGNVRLLVGDMAGALELGREARDRAAKTDGERSYDTAKVHYLYGVTLASAGREPDAEAEWRAALASFVAMRPPDGLHLDSADVRIDLGRRLVGDEAHRDEGERLLRQGVALREQFLGADDSRAREAEAVLAAIDRSRAQANAATKR
jgi:serine/threonine-protein kinase